MFGSYPRGLGPLGEQTLEIGSVAVLSPAPQYFHLRHFSGQLRSGYSPVLTITSDQASMMFAAANFLAYSCGLRLVWFPDINHIESNAEKAVFVATGIPQINEKVSFLARLPYGPRKNAGHWHSQMQQAFEAPAFFPQQSAVIESPSSLRYHCELGPSRNYSRPPFVNRLLEILPVGNHYFYSIFRVVFGFLPPSIFGTSGGHIDFVLFQRLSDPSCAPEMLK
jgi:hypothetical protein